jgi:hypothetical protein
MSLPNRTRSSGPKTAAGRKIVANNALKHGLTAARPATEAEAALIDTLCSDLVAEYQPKNTLEKLQIDRIARCAAKLQRLHEIEEAAYQLAKENAFPPLEDIVAAMGVDNAAAQAEAACILKGGSRTPTRGLDDALLGQMCAEIRANRQRVSTLADLPNWLPHIHAFLEQHCQQMGTADKGLQLQALVRQFSPLTQTALRPQREDMETLSDDKLLQIVAIEYRAKGLELVRVRTSDDAAAQAEGLQADLQALLDVQQHRQQVDDLVRDYPARRELLRRLAMPPSEEADRLLRYQVALDRQLSKCMGELLQMLAMRNPALP